MHRKLSRILGIALFSLLATALFAQEEFSAELINDSAKGGSSGPTKIYVSKDKMRFEGHEQNGRTGTMIMNFAAQTTDILMPGKENVHRIPHGTRPRRPALI